MDLGIRLVGDTDCHSMDDGMMTRMNATVPLQVASHPG